MNKIKIFKQDVLTIAERIIISKDSFIQMDNITRVWFGKIEVSIPVFKILLVLVLGFSILNTPFSSIGVVIILGDIVVIAYYVYLWSHYSLSFELSSGKIYAFTTTNQEFLKISYDKVRDIMENNNGIEKKYQIDFSNCQIDIVKDNVGTININKTDNSIHTNINSNNANSFNTTNSNNNDSLNTTINYTSMEKELSELLSVLNEKEEDFELIKAAKELVVKRDEKGLKEIFKKVSKGTLKIIEASASFVTLGQFISLFIK